MVRGPTIAEVTPGWLSTNAIAISISVIPVSTTLIRASSVRWMIRIKSARSSLPHGPNIIAPRHRGLTCTPVRPSGRCSTNRSSCRRAGPSGLGDLPAEGLPGDGRRLRAAADTGVEGIDGAQLLGAELEGEDVEVL